MVKVVSLLIQRQGGELLDMSIATLIIGVVLLHVWGA